MNIKCRATGCTELSNKMYDAPIYDTEFAVPLCPAHVQNFRLMQDIPNIVKEDGVWKVVCYSCYFKWVPRSFTTYKTWTAGTMKGVKYGDLPLSCAACNSMVWNNPHINSRIMKEVAEREMRKRTGGVAP